MRQNLTVVLNVESIVFLSMSVICTVLFARNALRDWT